ncbi:DUF7344 domain-containing protein [Halosegnis longus]|uniref:DUF7344 domain-containing protein n=1 Tax=Halosegnis longus TaxID=2216012 RepID=UPI0009AE5D35|nr:hypothetical protein [Salella cibi]
MSRTEVFDILSNDRRRHALHYLLSRESGAEIGELSEQIAAWENDEAIEEVTADERRRVYVSLHQTHLPRMDEAGVLQYENSRDTIELTERGESLRVYMEIVEGNEIPWSEFYLGLSALSASLLAALWMDAALLSLVPDLAWMCVVVLLFGITSVAHIYYADQRRLGSDGAPPSAK